MSTSFKNTRATARAAGDMFYFTGIPCINGHVAIRFVSCAVCVSCKQAYEATAQYKSGNLARVNSYHRADPERAKARSLKWRAKNKHKANAIEAKRRAAKLNATPSWLTSKHLTEIDTFFAEAVRLHEQTGVIYHVDHVIPLQGETVSGLHVPWNLRVISAVQNLSKHNKLLEECAS